ncbi:hypothetical protein ABZ777_15605 [Micromonospora parva]
MVTDALAAHLKAYPAPDRTSYVFTTPAGVALSRNAFNGSVWR